MSAPRMDDLCANCNQRFGEHYREGREDALFPALEAAESNLLADALAALRALLDAPVSGDGATINRREVARDKARAVLARAKETVDAYPPGVALCPICHQPLWAHSCVDLSCPAS